LHHYGSGLNAIPVLSEYRDHPDDFYLLRVGYAGTMECSLTSIRKGFCPRIPFLSDMLRSDPVSGDNGPNFFGHAWNAATYVVQHPEFGWVAFGGNLRTDGDVVRVTL